MMTDQFHFDNPIIPGSIWDENSDFTVPVVSPVGAGPKGEKGDPTYFDDLTPEQLQEIYQAASFVGNRSLDETVVTSGASTTVIDIPWIDYDQFDMLFIDVNGLDLAEGDDYTISGNSIVLATPLPAGQDVHFRLLRYDVVDGNKNIVNTMGLKDYNTVVEMQADIELKPGDICHTLGFHAAGDGGAAWYKIKAYGAVNDMNIISLKNGYVANLQITESYVTPEMFGAKGDGIHDDSAIFQYAINHHHHIKCISNKNYLCNNLTVESNTVIDFNNCEMSVSGKKLFNIVANFNKLVYQGEYQPYAVTGFNTGDGLVYVTSNELAHPGRDNYFAGFVGYSDKNNINVCLPYAIQNARIYKQTKSIQNVVFKNLKAINHLADSFSQTNIDFNVEGVSDIVFDNINFESPCYAGIYVWKSHNVSIINSSIKMIKNDNGSFVNTYNIGFLSGTTNCLIDNCSLFNNFWHCATTGGNETNLNIKILNSTLITDSSNSSIPAYADHGNTINTIIENCIIAPIVSIADGVIRKCNIIPTSHRPQSPAVIVFFWLGGKYKSSYVVEDIITDSDTSTFTFNIDVDTQNNETYTIECDSIKIKNYNTIGNGVIDIIPRTVLTNIAKCSINNLIIEDVFGLTRTSLSLISKKTLIRNCNVQYVITSSTSTTAWAALVDFDNDLYFEKSTFIEDFGGTIFKYAKVFIDNCIFNGTSNRINANKLFILKNSYSPNNIVISSIPQTCEVYVESIFNNFYCVYKNAGTTTFYTKLKFNSELVQH